MILPIKYEALLFGYMLHLVPAYWKVFTRQP